jgi:TRAP-type mannitol/chloroaromatic compound transport system permease small subunit
MGAIRMGEMMDGMNAMMGGMVVAWLVALAVLLLVGAAAIKYLFFERRKEGDAKGH